MILVNDSSIQLYFYIEKLKNVKKFKTFIMKICLL